MLVLGLWEMVFIKGWQMLNKQYYIVYDPRLDKWRVLNDVLLIFINLPYYKCQ